MPDRRFPFLEEPPQVVIDRSGLYGWKPEQKTVDPRLKLKLALFGMSGRIVDTRGRHEVTISIPTIRDWQAAIRAGLRALTDR